MWTAPAMATPPRTPSARRSCATSAPARRQCAAALQRSSGSGSASTFCVPNRLRTAPTARESSWQQYGFDKQQDDGLGQGTKVKTISICEGGASVDYNFIIRG
jgi:hypothetical protein